MATRDRSPRPPRPAEQRPKNRLLARLPESDFQRLNPHLTTVRLEARQILHTANEPLPHVVFLNGGVASITTAMTDGAMVEVATVGDEGVVGISAFLDEGVVASEAMMQIPNGSAEVMAVRDFRREMQGTGVFQDGVRRFAQGLLIQFNAINCVHGPASCTGALLPMAANGP